MSDVTQMARPTAESLFAAANALKAIAEFKGRVASAGCGPDQQVTDVGAEALARVAEAVAYLMAKDEAS